MNRSNWSWDDDRCNSNKAAYYGNILLNETFQIIENELILAFDLKNCVSYFNRDKAFILM